MTIRTAATLGPCVKTYFETEQIALDFEAQNNGTREFAYLCETCGGYHLSALPTGVSTMSRVQYTGNGLKRKGPGETREKVRNMRAAGLDERQIADKLGMSPLTIRYHFKKLDGLKSPSSRTRRSAPAYIPTTTAALREEIAKLTKQLQETEKLESSKSLLDSLRRLRLAVEENGGSWAPGRCQTLQEQVDKIYHDLA